MPFLEGEPKFHEASLHVILPWLESFICASEGRETLIGPAGLSPGETGWVCPAYSPPQGCSNHTQLCDESLSD